MLSPVSRRQFLQTTSLAAAAMAVEYNASTASPQRSASNSTQKKPLIQIGILLGTIRSGTLEARLDAVKAAGIDAVQWSMDCAGLPMMPDAIAPELTQKIRRAAAERGIKLASVAGTFNMCHPDAEHRQTGLRRLRVLAEACPQLGVSKIHLCTGTRDRNSMWRRHPDNDTPP